MGIYSPDVNALQRVSRASGSNYIYYSLSRCPDESASEASRAIGSVIKRIKDSVFPGCRRPIKRPLHRTRASRMFNGT